MSFSEIDEKVMFKWNKMKDINIKLAAHNLIVYEDSLYFFFGERADALYFEDISNEAIVYSFKEKTFKIIKFPLSRMFMTCVQNEELLYFFGGHDINVDSNSHLYKINMKKLTIDLINPEGNIPLPRRYHSATLLNEKIWIFGGEKLYFDTPLSNELFFFDLKKNHWKLVIPLNKLEPSKRRYSTLEGKNNRLYMFGGRDGHNRMNDMWIFDVLLESWSLMVTDGEKPPQTAACSSCMNGYSIFYFGGNTGNSCNSLYEYDTICNKWTKIFATGDIPPNRYWHVSVMTDFNEMIIHGGYNEIVDNRDDTYKIYLPKRNKNPMIEIEVINQRKFFCDVTFGFK
eukprot:gene6679-10844_t